MLGVLLLVLRVTITMREIIILFIRKTYLIQDTVLIHAVIIWFTMNYLCESVSVERVI